MEEDKLWLIYPRGGMGQEAFERLVTTEDLAYLCCRMARCRSRAEAAEMRSYAFYEVSFFIHVVFFV